MKEYLSLDNLPSTDKVQKNSRSRKWKLVFKIAILVILGILALYLLLNLLIHPINQLKLKMMIMQNYEIIITRPFSDNKTYIKVDGRYVSVSRDPYTPYQYYEITKDGVNLYENINGNGWAITQTGLDKINIGGGSGTALDELLDRKKFSWIPGVDEGTVTLRGYGQKKDAEIDGMDHVRFYVKKDHYVFSFFPETNSQYTATATITFTNFGKTKVILPYIE